MVLGMARPKGHTLNPDAFDAWLTARGLSRTDVAERSGIALNTISGLTSADPARVHGASTKTAYKLAHALRVPPGALFWDLIGQVPDEEAAA